MRSVKVCLFRQQLLFDITEWRGLRSEVQSTSRTFCPGSLLHFAVAIRYRNSGHLVTAPSCRIFGRSPGKDKLRLSLQKIFRVCRLTAKIQQSPVRIYSVILHFLFCKLVMWGCFKSITKTHLFKYKEKITSEN